MMSQIKILAKLELINVFSLNVIAHTKDKKAKKISVALGITVGVLILMAISYVSGLSYGFIKLGAAEIVPAYLVFLSSFFTLLFCAFKAAKIIFKESCYDILSSMPIKKSALVISRYIRLYVEGLIVACVVMLPGIIVYSCMVKPGIVSVILGCLSIFFVPVIPVAFSVLLGVIITGIVSKTRNKSLFEALFVVIIILGMFIFSAAMSANKAVSFDMKAMEKMAKTILEVICKIYPPSAWFASALGIGNEINFVVGVFSSIVFLIVVVSITTINFERINQSLRINTAKHDYKLGRLEKNTIMKALVYREAKRYFSSATYVTNTIVGPIMAVAFAVSMFFIDFEQILNSLPIKININGVIPIFFAGVFVICNPIATSVSMEGKEFWIVKTLPILDKDILKGKLMFNAILLLPFYVVGEIIMVIALKPSLLNLVWMIILPIIIVMCSLVMGLAINLKFPKLRWNSDVEVVKQSAASVIGGFVGVLLSLVSLIPFLIVPAMYYNLVACGVSVVIILITILVNKRNSKFELKLL